MHNLTDVPHQIAQEEPEESNDATILRLASNNSKHWLNPSAELVWRCIDGVTDIGRIVQDLQEVFPDSSHSIQADVTSLLNKFVSDGLIELAPSARYRPNIPIQKPPGVLFLANHGAAIAEACLMYRAAEVPLWLAGPLLRDVLPNVLTPHQADLYRDGEAKIAYTIGQIHQLIIEGKIGVVVFVVPEDSELIRSIIGDVPLVLRHSTGSNERLKRSAPYSFISPSASAINFVNAPNQYQNKKCVDFQRLDETRKSNGLPVSQRQGFFTFINGYQRFSDSYATYRALCKAAGELDLRYYGEGSHLGSRNADEALMVARATVHIKADGVCCNAVIESISAGVPVVMDRNSCVVLGLESYVVHGESGLLFDTVEEGVAVLRKLAEDDEYLDQLSKSTLALARRRCQLDNSDILNIKNFLIRATDSACLSSNRPP
jgi:hypothetical protein